MQNWFRYFRSCDSPSPLQIRFLGIRRLNFNLLSSDRFIYNVSYFFHAEVFYKEFIFSVYLILFQDLSPTNFLKNRDTIFCFRLSKCKIQNHLL